MHASGTAASDVGLHGPAAQIVAATVAAHDRDGDGRLSQKEFRRLLVASSETSMSISVS